MARRIIELEVAAAALEGAMERQLQHSDSFYSIRTSTSTDRLSGNEECSPRNLETHAFDSTNPPALAVSGVDWETQAAVDTMYRVRYMNKSISREAQGERAAALERRCPPSDQDDQTDLASQVSASDGSDDEDNLSHSPMSLGKLRTNLPHPAPLTTGVSIWGILKNAIGKDLTKITLPATINEPLSALQRFAEELEYAAFVEKASHEPSVLMRALWMTLFAVSPCNSIILRDRKPFNPLLGETFEWTSMDGKHRAAVEQVSSTPQIVYSLW